MSVFHWEGRWSRADPTTSFVYCWSKISDMQGLSSVVGSLSIEEVAIQLVTDGNAVINSQFIISRENNDQKVKAGDG